LNSQISDWGFYEDNIAQLRQSQDICDYHISYNHSGWSEVVSELNNTCSGGIKHAFIERNSYYYPPGPGRLYSYLSNDYAYARAGNPLFKNVLIKHFGRSISQISYPVTYQQFLATTTNNRISADKIDPNDFLKFVTSFRSTEPSTHTKTSVETSSSDNPDTKVVKDYFNLLAQNDFRAAYSLLLNPEQSEKDFISSQEEIYDTVITELNQIGDHKVEVFMQTQKHNRNPELYREVFEVRDKKLEKKLSESINGEISKHGTLRTYASERGLQSLVVLNNGSQEAVIDSLKHKADQEWWSTFYSPRFSPNGRYIQYFEAYYEGGIYNIYDISTERIIKDIWEGEFNPEETLFYTCSFSEAYGPTEALIYDVPSFSRKIDLLQLHPELSHYTHYSCTQEPATNTITFTFSGKYDGSAYDPDARYDPEATVIYKFNLHTGEPVQ